VLVPTALAMTLPLAFRRRWPLTTVLVVFAAAALQELLTTPPDGIAGVTALLVASYSVAAYSDRRPAVVGLAGALALSLFSGVGDAVFAWVLIGGSWGAGRIVRRQNRLLDALAREQAIRERAAVVDERARLARELHDVVAHSVSTMVVQAEAGELLLRATRTAREKRSSRSRALGATRSVSSGGCLGSCAVPTASPPLGRSRALRRSTRSSSR
jgi:signal transduction histidine kinase